MIKRFPLTIIFIIIGFIAASSVSAATPILSLSAVGGDYVQISVSGDASSNVMFYYNVGSASGMQVMTIGSTDASGLFSTTVSTSAYGINSGNSAYVIINGQQSPMQTWPNTSTTSSLGTPSLSQNNLTLGIGQSITITSQANTTAVYLSTNSNSSAVGVQINGTQITVTGNQVGTATLAICYAGTSSNCANLYATVQNSSAQALSFSQNNITLAQGQNASVTVSGGGGTYTVTGNSNSSAAKVTLSGNALTVYGVSAGSSNMTVCDQSNNCGTLYATVTGNASSGSLSFSPSSPYVAVGQSTTVNISGGTEYYVYANSNPNVVLQSMNGSVLTVSGVANGSATLTVCSTANACGSVNVTVGSSGTGQSVSFSASNPTITVGQNMNITLSGGPTYYVSSNSNSNIVQANLSSNTLIIYGLNPGSASISVCVTSGSCNTLYVTVTSNASATTQTQTSQTSYTALLSEIQSMQNQLAQIVTTIQTMTSRLAQLASGITASASNSGTVLNSSTTGQSDGYKFLNFIGVGSSGNDVSELQKRLSAEGFYSGSITGYYGSLTETAVKKYQAAHGIAQLGYVGPSTRTLLNGQ